MTRAFVACFLSLLGCTASTSLLAQNLSDWGKSFLDAASNRGPPELRLRRTWDALFLQRAVAVTNHAQLIPLFERLEAGLPLMVVGLGSSVVASNGGCYNNRAELYKHVEHVRTNMNPEFCVPHGWLGSMMNDINNSWPHPGHVYINLGQPGGDITQYAQRWCFTGTLPKEVDLFVVEDHGGWNFYKDKGAQIEQLFVQLGRRGREGHPPAMLFLTTMFVIDSALQG